MSIDATAFRETMAHVPTSVSVITTVDERGLPYGVTVGTLCSLSLDPPLLLFCLNRQARSHRVFSAAEHFLVNVLRHDQDAVARRFAISGIDRCRELAGATSGPHGLCVIPDAVATVLCRRHRIESAGDHSIVIGLVEDATIGSGPPLLHYNRDYCMLPTGR